MSGALVSLVARGAQDSFIVTDEPEHSLFRMRYTRHTNYGMAPKYIETIKGVSNSRVVVEIPSYGDLLTYLWMEGDNISESMRGARVELYIGGQLIESHSATFLTDVWPIYMADAYTKCQAINNRIASSNKGFFPLHFFFNDNWQHIPMVALQFHKVELHIVTGPQQFDAKVYGNYVFLDAKEREMVASSPKQFLITQVQEITTPLDDDTNVIDLGSLNHPVRSLYWGYRADSANPATDKFTFQECDIHINGVPILEKMSPVYFHSVQGYFHTPTGLVNMDPVHNCPFYTRFFSHNFCLNSSSYKPTGTVNFSRLDNAKMLLRGVVRGSDHLNDDLVVFAVSYNLLRIERGLGGVLFSN